MRRCGGSDNSNVSSDSQRDGTQLNSKMPPGDDHEDGIHIDYSRSEEGADGGSHMGNSGHINATGLAPAPSLSALPKSGPDAEIGLSHSSDNPAQGGGGQGLFHAPIYHRDLYNDVRASGQYNFAHCRRRVPSGLNIRAWQEYLEGYADENLVQFLEYGWPVGFDRSSDLCSASTNHATAIQFSDHIQYYIDTELRYGALLGPFLGPPIESLHINPLMTRPKRDSTHRRVIVDLSFPHGLSVNDGVSALYYIDGPMTITLPSVHTMEQRILEMGKGAFMYKSDLARGYRQLRIDPYDWDLLGFSHDGRYYLDVCPPFGLRSSAMMMVRTTTAIVHIHASQGHTSFAYIDDFGGAERDFDTAEGALGSLQKIFGDLGIEEAAHKVCPPGQVMTWLGIEFNTLLMTMSLPPGKIKDIRDTLDDWDSRQRASRREIQSLFGLLQFITAVAPPARLFTNRILEAIRETEHGRTTTLSWGFRRDVQFFRDLMPGFKGVKIMDKVDLPAQATLELDACLSGCGAIAGNQFYGREFPGEVRRLDHPIAHLEMLNIVVAIKLWCEQWSGYRVRIHCDNLNAVLVLQTGRSRDSFMQACAREIHLHTARRDISLLPVHCPGVTMTRADALSREHLGRPYSTRVAQDPELRDAQRLVPKDEYFQLHSTL